MNVLHAIVVIFSLLTFVVRWHYVMADIKARSIESRALRSSDNVYFRASPPAGDGMVCARGYFTPPKYKRDPDIFLDNEEIGQPPLL
ncbi:unnamed protein product [Parnassius mnemosyne]|uniref:Secreted protein n=1 Tax=Parnassius mnemosyne TaxID=213953 RepID=A0AAV1LF99_9NEOP